MITTIFIYIFSFFLGLLAQVSNVIAKGWTVWPPDLLAGLTYFFQHLMDWNIIFPVDSALIIFKFLITFITLYFTVGKILFKIFNFLRGADIF